MRSLMICLQLLLVATNQAASGGYATTACSRSRSTEEGHRAIASRADGTPQARADRFASDPREPSRLTAIWCSRGQSHSNSKVATTRFFIEAGPEFQTRTGHFSIERHAEDETQVLLTRRVNMQCEGWWAGDLDVAQRLEDMPLSCAPAGVDYVPVTTAENFQWKCRDGEAVVLGTISEISPPLFGPWAAIDQPPRMADYFTLAATRGRTCANCLLDDAVVAAARSDKRKDTRTLSR